MKKLIFTLSLLMISTTSYAYEEGDYICVKSFQKGHGYCGTVDRVTSKKYKIKISNEDCSNQSWWQTTACKSQSCSGGEVVNEYSIGKYVWAEKRCAS